MTSSDKNYVTVEDLIQIAVQFEIDSAELYKRMQATAGEDNVLEILRLLERQERPIAIGALPDVQARFVERRSIALAVHSLERLPDLQAA